VSGIDVKVLTSSYTCPKCGAKRKLTFRFHGSPPKGGFACGCEQVIGFEQYDPIPAEKG
jgi:hypothetical protein